MGWQIQWGHKPWETVDGNTLRQYASNGTLTLDTPVKSLIKGKTVRAGDIQGLFLEPALPMLPQIDEFAMAEPARDNDGELIDVWRVSPNLSGDRETIIIDDCVDAEAFAREVLEDIFGELGNGESETIIIERTQMLRSEFNKLEDA